LGLSWKRNGWTIDSNTTWATAFPYGAGRMTWNFDANGNPVRVDNGICVMTTDQGQQCLNQAEAPNSVANSLRGPAWYNENLSVSHRLGSSEIGITANNLFNDIKSPVPTANFYYLNTSGSGNFAPQHDCANLSAGVSCYDAIYPSPNAFKYPVAGYYQQETLTPREFTFWWRVNV
ncbi:MAG: hypothetical protein M3Z37_01100, partial [Candidatus Eremiobacteraeota bacterium]|nr:hypothetical protein [Candidatus Eremiobacteraeota bacterium]